MKKLIALILFAFCGVSYAGSAGSGNLHTIHYMGNGAVIVYTTGVRSADIPPCATTGNLNRFAIDGTSNVGKVQLSGLLSAYATGKKVIIYGAGNCGPWGDAETISYFYMDD